MKIFLLCFLLLCSSVCHAQTPSALNASLFAAVETQDVARVKSLLTHGANPNTLNDRKFSVLNEAIENHEPNVRKAQILRLLLVAGADPNALDGSQISPMANAAAFDADAFRLILSAPGPHKPDKETALVLAAYGEYLDVVKRLLREGVSANASTDVSSVAQGFRATALMKASAAGSPQAVELLLQNGARVNTLDETGKSALMWAVDGQNTIQANPAVVRLLLRAGTQIELRDGEGATPLLQAVGTRNEEAAQLLLQAGAKVNARDNSGQTALMEAFYSASLTRLLLERHPELNLRDAKGETALMKAVKWPNEDEGSAAVALIEAGADVQVRDAQGRDLIAREGAHIALPVLGALLASGQISAEQRAFLQKIRPNLTLFEAVYARDAKRVRSALENGADVNARNQYDYTPLLLAIPARDDDAARRTRSVTLTRLLLEHGADPNLGIETHAYATPLTSARDNAPVLKLLLDAGANPNAHDEFGRTALTQLCLQRRATPEAVKLLLEAGANPNARDKWGVTVLMAAVFGQSDPEARGENELPFARLVEQLLAAGLEIDATDDLGQTALMKAAYGQQTENVQTLLQRGAAIEARDKTGQTVLMRACQVLVISGSSSGSSNQVFYPSPEMLKLLIGRGANPNARDNAGQTALIRLAKLNPREDLPFLGSARLVGPEIEKRKAHTVNLAQILIANGADVSLLTGNGNTALKWARVRGNKELVALLEASGAK